MAENKITILAVDDEEYIRRLIARILTDAGYEVVTAASGKEALEKLAGAGINLVLLDVKMPNMDGFQTLELIRKQYPVPVIMVSGVSEVTSVSDALSIGADDYIKKPFQAREMVARIQAKLRRNRGPNTAT